LKGARGRGTLAKEKPPIFGMLQRGGAVVIRMLENVKQVTIGPLIKQTIAEGSLVYTDEYDIYSRLEEWGYGHETVCHAKGSNSRRLECVSPWLPHFDSRTRIRRTPRAERHAREGLPGPR
jgi:transposase